MHHFILVDFPKGTCLVLHDFFQFGEYIAKSSLMMKPFPQIACAPTGSDKTMVWSCDIPTPSQSGGLDPYLFWLSEDERQKAERYKQITDRNAYVMNHLLLRMMLSECFDVAPDLWAFSQDNIGCAHIVSIKSISLSRTSKMAVAAFSMKGVLGVDVEGVDRFTSFKGGYSKALTPEERKSLHETPDENRDHELARFWTRKEAVSKALRQGLMMAFDRVDVRYISPRSSDPVLSIDFEAPWEITSFASEPNHIISVATRWRGNEADLNFSHIPFVQFQKKAEPWGHLIESV
jgi:4'-phosphopantetheinyl transferase